MFTVRRPPVSGVHGGARVDHRAGEVDDEVADALGCVVVDEVTGLGEARQWSAVLAGRHSTPGCSPPRPRPALPVGERDVPHRTVERPAADCFRKLARCTVGNMKRLLLALLIVWTGWVQTARAAPVHPANISNAPAWQPSTTYSIGQEVATAGGSGAAGTRGYKALSAGTSCASPAVGPSGTGSDISDCGVRWKYLSDIDYTSISLWLARGIPHVTAPQPWAQGTPYSVDTIVTTTNTPPTQAYYAATAGTSCAAGTGPSGTGTSISDCGVTWSWLETLTPPLTTANAAIRTATGEYIGYVYNGGEYLNDGNTLTPTDPHYGHSGIIISGHSESQAGGESYPLDWHLPIQQSSSIVLTAAPGESLADVPDAPLSYDPSNGVAINCTTDPGGTNTSACLLIGDWNVFVSRIQIKSSYNGVTFYTHGGITNCLIDAAYDAVWSDAQQTFANDVIYAGNIGFGIKYNTTLINSTVFGRPGSVIGVYQVSHPSFAGAPHLVDTAIMGFTYCAAYSSGMGTDMPGFERAAPPSDYNATDVGSGGIQDGTASITWTVHNGLNSSQPATSMPCPGAHSLYDVPFTTATFANTTSGSLNARLVAGSSLIGAGGPAVNETLSLVPSNSDWPAGAALNFTANCANPAPSPYGTNGGLNACGNPLMTVSGVGIPSGLSIVALAGIVKNSGFVAMTDSCGPGCGTTAQDITLSYQPLQAGDFFGSARPTYDIGAMEYGGMGGMGPCGSCAVGLVCDVASGLCEEPSCVGVACASGTHCMGGDCIRDCGDGTCPPGQTCTPSGCVDASCTPACGPGLQCMAGVCRAGVDGGTPGGVDGGTPGGGDGGTSGGGASSGGCCEVAVGAPGERGASVAFLALVLTAILFRRKRR